MAESKLLYFWLTSCPSKLKSKYHKMNKNVWPYQQYLSMNFSWYSLFLSLRKFNSKVIRHSVHMGLRRPQAAWRELSRLMSKHDWWLQWPEVYRICIYISILGKRRPTVACKSQHATLSPKNHISAWACVHWSSSLCLHAASLLCCEKDTADGCSCTAQS